MFFTLSGGTGDDGGDHNNEKRWKRMTMATSRGSGLPTLGSPLPKSVAPTEGGSVRSGSVLAHYPGFKTFLEKCHKG